MNEIREHFSSKVGFVLASIGSTIGLGLLWKFPYVVGQNGGGLFLFFYFFSILVIGVPLFMGEVMIGRYAQRASVSAFQVIEPSRKFWKIGGFLGAAASFLIMTYYSVIAGWGLSYLLMSLLGFYEGKSNLEIAAVFDRLASSGSITTFWHFIFTALPTVIVMGGVRKGIEYWSRIMVKVLFVLLFILFCYSVTLPGFGQAVDFIFRPDFSKFNGGAMLEALGLAFLTMSLGQGIMISYGSYLKKKENVARMDLVVGASVMLVAVLAALTIFPVVFTFGLDPKSGPTLVFQTLPFLFAKLPFSMLLSSMFFILFVFTALTSAVPLIEGVAANLLEHFPIGRKAAALAVGTASFLLGIPSALSYSRGIFPNWQGIFRTDFRTTVDDLVSIWIIPLAGLFTTLFLGYVFKKEIMQNEFGENVSPALFPIWVFLLRYVCPFIIVLLLLD